MARPTPRPAFIAAVFILVGASLLAASWAWKGLLGVSGSSLGLGIGGAIALTGHILRQGAWTDEGYKLVRTMMLSLCVSFGLFVASALAVCLLWREGAAPTLLTALGIYLTASFLDAALKA